MTDLTHIDLTRFETSAGKASSLLKALANPRRLMILCQLGGQELTVGALQPLVGLSQSALSQHLAKLREEGLVATRRDAQTVHYRVADPAAGKVIATLAEIFCPPETQSLDQ